MDVVIGQQVSDKRSRWLSPLSIVIYIVTIIALVAGGTILWQRYRENQKTADRINAAITQSEAAYKKSEFTNALNIVKPVLGELQNNDQKARAYQAAAQAAMGAAKYDQAAKYYELKHKANPSTEGADSYTLGYIYQQLGEKDKALAQYKIALKYAKEHKNQYTSDEAAIQAAIDDLEGKEQ